MIKRIQEIEQFLKSKGHTKKTIDTYSSTIGKVLSKLGLTFTEEKLEHLFTYWNISPRTYNHHRCIMNFYTKKYLNYSLSFTKAKVESALPTFVTIDELFILLRQISNFKHKMGISLMYFSGLRVSEVCRLRKKDIDFENQIIWVRQGKGKKDRRTILVTKLAHYLNMLCNKIEDYLFPTYRGHISERSFEEVLRRARIKSGLKKEFTCHDLRHSFAINLVNKGIDIEEVRKMLGHSKLTTTQIYLQCKNQNLTAIARSV